MSVVNIRSLRPGWESDPQYVYIGRAGRRFDGYFGNPFPMAGKDWIRDRVLERFMGYADERIERDPEFRERVKGLYGKTLVCFCDPKPCHGDYLEYLADHLFEGDLDLPADASEPRAGVTGPA